MRRRGARHRERAVDPGPARAAGRQAGAGRPACTRASATPRATSCRYLALWTYLREQQRERSGNNFRRMCRDEYLHYLRVREWQDVHSQLRQACKDLGIEVGRLGHRATAARTTRRPCTARSSRACSPTSAPTTRCAATTSARAVPGGRSTRGRRSRASRRSSRWPPSSSRPRGCSAAWSPASTPRRSRRSPGDLVQRSLLRAALEQEARGGRRRRAGHAVRRTARGRSSGAVRPHRPGRVARPVHPARAGGRRVGRRTTGSCATTRGGVGGRRDRGPRPAARPPGGRRGARRVLRGAAAAHDQRRPRLRPVVDATSGARAPTCSPTRATCSCAASATTSRATSRGRGRSARSTPSCRWRTRSSRAATSTASRSTCR